MFVTLNRAASQYTGKGVSGAAVSAGKAEPTDQNAAYNLETNLLFSPVTRTPGNAQKRRSSCQRTFPILDERAVSHHTQI